MKTMDPNATLAEIRRIILRITSNNDGQWQGEDLKKQDRDRLVELTQAMDEWLSKGGFLPDQWSGGR